MAVQRAAASAMTAASRECLFGSWDALRAVSTNAGGRRGKERAARYERSSDWRRGAAGSPDPCWPSAPNCSVTIKAVQPAVPGFDETDPRPPTSDTQPDSGIYAYSIIECQEPRTYGKIGIGGRGDEVYTVHYKDLAAVVSRTPLVVYDPTRENVLAHEHLNEVIIEEGFTPVPMSFGTLFKTEKDIVEFLEDTYDALRDVLGKMKDKLEFGLRVNWAREQVLAEIERDDEGIRRLKEEISKSQQASTYFARMQLGRMVEQALADKSDAYVRDIYEYLRAAAIASRSNKPIGAKMLMSAALPVEPEPAG